MVDEPVTPAIQTRRDTHRSLRREAAVSLLRTADALRRHLEGVFEPYDLTGQQYNVLRILRGASPEALPTMEIVERMIEKAPGITRLVDRLEQKGLITRERSGDDRRQVFCTLTARAKQILDQLDEPVDDADENALAVLDDMEVRQLTSCLDRVRERLG